MHGNYRHYLLSSTAGSPQSGASGNKSLKLKQQHEHQQADLQQQLRSMASSAGDTNGLPNAACEFASQTRHGRPPNLAIHHNHQPQQVVASSSRQQQQQQPQYQWCAQSQSQCQVEQSPNHNYQQQQQQHSRIGSHHYQHQFQADPIGGAARCDNYGQEEQQQQQQRIQQRQRVAGQMARANELAGDRQSFVSSCRQVAQSSRAPKGKRAGEGEAENGTNHLHHMSERDESYGEEEDYASQLRKSSLQQQQQQVGGTNSRRTTQVGAQKYANGYYGSAPEDPSNRLQAAHNQHDHHHQHLKTSGAPQVQQQQQPKQQQQQQQQKARPLQVNFNRSSQGRSGGDESEHEEESRKKKYLTAKYGQQQMSLIKKRLKIEMWLCEQLQQLANSLGNVPEGELDKMDIDLDELLDMPSDEPRAIWLRQTLAPLLGHLPRNGAEHHKQQQQQERALQQVEAFIQQVLEQIKLL